MSQELSGRPVTYMATLGKIDNPDGIITARLRGTGTRWAGRRPLDVDAAIKEPREIAGGRTDLLAHSAGILIGSRPPRAEETFGWPTKAVAGALCIADGADLTKLDHWITVALDRQDRMR
jgi:hypothetical protein